MFYIRDLYGKNTIYIFTNYLTTSGNGIDYSRAFSMLILSPLQEEFVFRGLLFFIIYNRLNDVISTIYFTNFMFGVFHLINIFANHYSSIYVILQVGLGILIGLFYSSRYLLSVSLFEPFLFHSFNNLFSSFISLKSQFDFTDPWFILPCKCIFLYFIIIHLFIFF